MTQDAAVLDERRSGAGDGPRTYSLVEVAQETGIPMPILLRYKREHPDRIPSQGTGSQLRFPEQAFAAFLAIQREESESRDLPRRGGFGLLSLPKLRRRVSPPEAAEAADEEPATVASAAWASAEPQAKAAGGSKPRKTGGKKAGGRGKRAPKKSSRPPTGGDGMLSLIDVSQRLNIPYPTAARYASQFEDIIPHVGRGRGRRFPPEALEVFERIRRESKPGRPPKGGRQGTLAGKLARARPAARKAAAAKPAAAARPAAATREAPRPAAAARGGDEGLARRIESLERSQQILEQELRDLIARLARPVTATVHQI